MSKCERCNKVAQGFMLYQFGYKELCFDCYRELKDKRDLKTEDELQDDKVIHSLNPEQIVRNFVLYFSKYQKSPSEKLLDILWRIRCWAAHEDHTASCAIHEIMRWQGFSFDKERDRFHGDNTEKKS